MSSRRKINERFYYYPAKLKKGETMELIEKKKEKLKKFKLEKIKLDGKIADLEYQIENQVFPKKKEKKQGFSKEKTENSKEEKSGWL